MPPAAVSIAPYAETISPLLLGNQKSVEDLPNLGEFRRPQVKKPRDLRLSGKRGTISSPSLNATLDGSSFSADQSVENLNDVDDFESLVDQVSSWIKEKRAKRHRRKSSRQIEDRSEPASPTSKAAAVGSEVRPRRGSNASDDSLDLDRLERIVKQTLHLRRSSLRKIPNIRRKSSVRKLLRKQSSASDTEYFEGDVVVPTCDAVLDNSKTLSYTGGASDVSDESGSEELRRVKSVHDNDAWSRFKFEIVRLTHTLRLKGWRKVHLEMSGSVEVQRLSGALTNAVYVVSPPADLPLQKEDGTTGRAPPKLLLRIYGPQVEHLIDREAELAILQRLARKRIGPRLLGTFANGRFEEFFHAETLTPDDLRDASTSRQIAKRMRELHEGIDLLDEERDEGPFVWRNWDKWLHRVEHIVTWMDAQVQAQDPNTKPTGSRAWLRRGYICGVPWAEFKAVVEKYRNWLKTQYGGSKHIREQLVFAHNDTQYGNILRLVPAGESPLLLPANTHKQLIVIDFEYASANTPGLEFANHFTEWCYNYHDKRKPYACNTNMYPTPEEQERFIRAYVRHRPHFNAASDTPRMTPVGTPDTARPADLLSRRSTTSISDFMLDARVPPTSSSSNLTQEATAKAAEDAEVKHLLHETRMWRLANTAQWVAWGIVQAKIPGMPLFEPDTPESESSTDAAKEILGEDGLMKLKEGVTEVEAEAPSEQDEEFDYLGYAQHRAMFFWGDALQLGLVGQDELPEEVRGKVKSVLF
jgi:choline kinase